ncbi:predicted protein [Nematostella vectensis]|uniref:Uncharacterized protein n=1 Tax=Nematostella vectensis TaxID=45351 RepID=A7RU73_NEMVE|nr:predicted protein [Nematostella vectensis]|eukprot:XP_001637094.1 predicted protein [Nematostella vectensis]
MGMENSNEIPQLEESVGRKSSKPMMEKRRRARINQSLNELKILILEAMKKDTSCYSKLEKADILEMTVKYLRAMKTTQQLTGIVPSDPSSVAQYRAGFNECALEVTRYFMANDNVDLQMKTRILSHLASVCRPCEQQQVPHNPRVPVQHPILPPAVSHSGSAHQTSSTVSKATELQNVFVGPTQFQIVPGQLANGRLAAVLVPSPASGPGVSSMPQLLPMFSKPPTDFQSLPGYHLTTSHGGRGQGVDNVWRPW